MAVWTDLPLDILVVIAQCLNVMEDFVSFSTVCKRCQYVTSILKKKASLPLRYPQLMHAEIEDVPLRGFTSLLASKTVRVELPEVSGSRCVGAHYGWLCACTSNLQINLLHPFSKQQICLPPLWTLPSHEKLTPQLSFYKIAMSATPLKGNILNDECIVVASCGELLTLAFAKLGDTVWTNIKVPCYFYIDVVYHKGKFYAVDSVGSIVVCDIEGNNHPEATVIASTWPLFGYTRTIRNYLVESSGDLLLVCRLEMENFDYKNDEVGLYTIGFSAFRLDESRKKGKYKLTKVTTLRDRALFLGSNVSISMASSCCIKANCIYFTDDHGNAGGRDTGVYNMKDGAIQLEYAGEYGSNCSPPLWYI